MLKRIVQVIFEMMYLKEIKNQGFKLIGIQETWSVAEHVLHSAQIWYILAKMEKANADKVCALLIWHDCGEIRIWDITRVGGRYIANKDEIEKEIVKDQFSWVDFGKDIEKMFAEIEDRTSLEWKIAKDADYLQQAFSAKKYLDLGNTKAKTWLDNIEKALLTKSARKLFIQLKKSRFTDWWEDQNLMWKDLKRIYKKLKWK